MEPTAVIKRPGQKETRPLSLGAGFLFLPWPLDYRCYGMGRRKSYSTALTDALVSTSARCEPR